MHSPNIFLTRTEHNLTCGIVNIPLTKPAQIYFNYNWKDNIKIAEDIIQVFNAFNIPHSKIDKPFAHKTMFTSNEEIESKIIKMIWRNYKSLRPKLISKWRYLMWEIDTLDKNTLDTVIQIYSRLNLPVYVNRSMRGYHFMSVKPILESVWSSAIESLRPTNLDYPPITIRVNPNKYIGEESVFFEGFIISSAYHADTNELRRLINEHDYTKLGEKYYLVWYNIDKKETEENE